MMSPKLVRDILCLLCLVSLPFVGCPADAQSQREAPLPSLLTPESQNVLDKLASLSALPKPDWRYHAGDLPARRVTLGGRCKLASRNRSFYLAGGGRMDAGHDRSAQKP